MFDFIGLAWEKIVKYYQELKFVSKSFSKEEREEYGGKITTVIVSSLIRDGMNELSDDDRLQIVQALGFEQELDNEGQVVIYTGIYDEEDVEKKVE